MKAAIQQEPVLKFQAKPSIRLIPIGDIIDCSIQPESRTAEPRLRQLARVIQLYGCKQPPLLDSKLRLLDGHRRVHVLRNLGQTHVWCVVLDEECPEWMLPLLNGVGVLKYGSRHFLDSWSRAAEKGATLAIMPPGTTRRIRELVQAVGTEKLVKLVDLHSEFTPSEADSVKDLRGWFARLELPTVQKATLAAWCCANAFWRIWCPNRKQATEDRVKRIHAAIGKGEPFEREDWR